MINLPLMNLRCAALLVHFFTLMILFYHLSPWNSFKYLFWDGFCLVKNKKSQIKCCYSINIFTVWTTWFSAGEKMWSPSFHFEYACLLPSALQCTHPLFFVFYCYYNSLQAGRLFNNCVHCRYCLKWELDRLVLWFFFCCTLVPACILTVGLLSWKHAYYYVGHNAIQ